jgi:hypothetical protein
MKLVRLISVISWLLWITAHRVPAPIVESQETPNPPAEQTAQPAEAAAAKPKIEVSESHASPSSERAGPKRTRFAARERKAATSQPTSAARASVLAASRSNAGRLIINRAANVGNALFLDVNIDGANAGTVGMGQTYTGSLSPGKHEVSVILRPNLLFLSPTKKTLIAESGKTYALTAIWQGDNLLLR